MTCCHPEAREEQFDARVAQRDLRRFRRRALGRAYRAYVHPPAAMAAVLERNGSLRSWAGGTWIWAVELFERVA